MAQNDKPTIDLILGKPNGLYSNSETVQGHIQFEREITNLKEAGYTIFLDDGDLDVEVYQEVLIEYKPAKDRLTFSFDKEDLGTFLDGKSDLEMVLRAFAVTMAGDKYYSKLISMVVSNAKCYQLVDEKIHISHLSKRRLAPIAVLIGLMFIVPWQIILVLAVLSLLYLAYLTIGEVIGALQAELVQVDEHSFNLVFENAGIWKMVKEVSIEYSVYQTKENREQNPLSTQHGKSKKSVTSLYTSDRFVTRKETGLWAKLEFPYPASIPVTYYRNGGHSVEWSMRIFIKTNFGIRYKYVAPFRVDDLLATTEEEDK